MSKAKVTRSLKPGKAYLRLGLSVSAGALDASGKRQVPDEFRVFSFGDNASEKGTFTFDRASAESVMALFAEHNKPMVIDYNHGSILSGVAPEVSINAAESFIPEVRTDGLYATKIAWTSRARGFIEAGEYTMFSPYFEHDKDGRVTRLINIALTNLPALDNLQPLVAASMNDEERKMPCEACAALTAQLTAKDAELSALRAQLAAAKEPDEDDKMKASALTQLTALTGQTALPASLGTIEGWKKKADGYDKLAQESAEREAADLRAQLTAVIDKGVTDAKVAPAEKAELEAMALAMGGGKPSKDGIARLTAYIAAKPKLVSTSEVRQPDPNSPLVPVALTAHELEVAARHGIKPEIALKAKQSIAAQAAARR